MHVLEEAHLLRLAEQREDAQFAFLERVRADLRALIEEGAPLAPFRGGSVFGQLRHELLVLEAEAGSSLARARIYRRRNNVSIKPRTRWAVYVRDGFACRECGWTPPVEGEQAKADYREGERGNGLRLTVDHVIPLGKGGPNRFLNMQTLCSDCNQAKGCSLPDALALVS